MLITDCYQKILEKEPIASTFIASDLLKNPMFVEETYNGHAETHISLGSTDEYIEKIMHTVTENKNCGVGAIIGPYGYGKTSTAIHVWHKLSNKKFLTIPPFRWHNLFQFTEAVYGWAYYKLNQVNPVEAENLKDLFEEYSQQSVNELKDEHALTEEQVESLLNKNRLNLDMTYPQLIDFCHKASDIALSNGFQGMVILTDELQETLEKYKDRDTFVTDMFGICSDLLNQPGKWTIIWGMPDQTETYLISERKDILDRMKDRQIYFRLTELYGPHFPIQLWQRYSKSYGFQDKSHEAITEETLEGLGQLAFHKELGRGPRTVVQGLKVAVEFFKKNDQAFNCIHMMDAFLEKKISFDEFGKINDVLTKALLNPIIQKNEENQDIVKLAAAFPEGVPQKYWDRYGLTESLEAIENVISGDILASKANGYTLKGYLVTYGIILNQKRAMYDS